MAIPDDEISRLENRLDSLVRTQIDFQKEITAIRSELSRLRRRAPELEDRPQTSFYDPSVRPTPLRDDTAPEVPKHEVNRPNTEQVARPPVSAPSFGYGHSKESESEPSRISQAFDSYLDSARADLEKFIGENLISKIGILVLVLGVGIGAKYAIDNNLISPLTRIVIGYVFGFGLIGLAIKLKAKYHNFSAVLISGGMAIMYFVTYFAYATYSLIPQLSAFALMVMFTAFTVAAAFAYNRQVIAHIGLVGAYAVPFLLSSDSGNYLALFSYMAIVNSGILAISIRKNWTPIFYTAFGFTWAIFYGWFISKFDSAEHLYLGLTFVSIFFGLFFATKIVQRRFLEETNEHENLVSALLNGLVFYIFCFAISSTLVGAGQTWAFFAFLAAATTAVLAISFGYYRQWFVYLTFPMVWLTFGAWYADNYVPDNYFALASVFASVFFAVFYLTTLFHRLSAGTFGFIEITTAALSNAFIFYGFGYSILDSDPTLTRFLGVFTAAHSALHLGVAHLVSRFKEEAADVVQVLTILVLTFATIAVPIQLDGNFVTLIWTVEAALLFWYGRTKGVELFEYFSYPIMALASVSLLGDWMVAYAERTSYPSELNRVPLANGDLITAMVFVAAFAFVWYVNREDEHSPVLDSELRRPIGWIAGMAAVMVLFNALRIEISNSHHLRIVDLVASGGNSVGRSVTDLELLNSAWQTIYVMAFLTAMAAINFVKGRSPGVAWITTGLGLLSLFVSSSFGMSLFSDLRESYIASSGAPGDGVGWLAIGIRYVGYLAAAALLLVLYRNSQDEELTGQVPADRREMGFEAAAYGTAFILTSCELVNVMGQLSIPDATKLGLSILWGVFALMLVSVGIAKGRKHLRIAAFVLLGVTLVKLFLYDIADLDTIPKTILFVTLGITLLAVSFLYNKYKNLILDAPQTGD